MRRSKVGWRGIKGTDAALVFGSGYLANTGIIPALVGPGDLILIDEFSHACMHAGAKLSGAAVAALSPCRCGPRRGAAGRRIVRGKKHAL